MRMNEPTYLWWRALVGDLRRFGELDADQRAERIAALAEVEPSDATAVDELLAALAPETSPTVDGREQALVAALQNLVQPWLYRDPEARLSPTSVERLAAWCTVVETASLVRFPALRTLAVDGSPAASAALAELLATHPPADPRQAVLTLVPLFQPRGESVPGIAAAWPRLFDCLEQPALAAAVADLANFVFRKGWLAVHPASERVGQLATLAGTLGQRLAQIEEHPERHASSAVELSRMVNDSVGLLVSLCDALALVGDRSVVGKLRPLLSLGHRRVQTEAGAALARLGEEEGVERLLELAREPVVRTRALAYLEEVGKLDRLDQSWRTPEARAEGELAAWMAQPTRFGMPPDRLELIDRKRQYWPGYVDPVECFLLVYEYERGDRRFGGVGIVGPTTSALQADLQDFPPDDVYALYAGFDAEHGEIYETPADELSFEQQDVWDRVEVQLGSQGFEDRELVLWGHFFESQYAVATATRDGRPGIVVVGEESTDWLPTAALGRGIGPREIYAMYKGRKLLRSFNSGGPAAS